MGRTRRRPSDSCSSTIGVLAWTSRRTPRSSIGTTRTTYPRPDRSGRASRPRSRVGVGPQRLAENRFPQLAAEPRHRLERGPRLAAGLWVALLHPRHDDLLDEPGLAVGGVAVQPQMAGLDAVPEELAR